MRDESLQAALDFLNSWLGYRARQVDIPGFCVAIYQKDSVVFSQAYGLANVELDEAMSTTHLFSVASQSKMFTAVAVLQLVESGKLRLDDFVYDYVPWLTRHHDKRFMEITVRQLLNHRAGLIRDGLDTDFWELRRTFPTTSELRASVLSSDIAVEPNRALKYSNLGYALLGQVIQAASGQTYSTHIAEHLIKPLKLKATHADYAPTLAKWTATGYSTPFNRERLSLEPRQATKALAAAVGIHATAEDLCRFAASQFFGDDTLLNDRLKKEAQHTQSIVTSGRDSGTEFGLGFRIQNLGNHRLIGHDGHLAGHLTATFFDPDAHIAVAVTANAQDAPSIQIVNGIFETLDWFVHNAPGPAPKKLARFNARLRSTTGSIEIIAAKQHIAAVDPDNWSPFTILEELEYIDSNTLRITTSGSMLQAGEFVRYTFAKDVVRAVRYAGLTMVPEAGYHGRALEELPSELDPQLTLDDVRHATLKIGHVLKVETCRGPLPLRLLVDFGPQLGAKYSYIKALPRAATKQMLIGKPVLGAVFPVWYFGKITHEILALGLTMPHQTNAPFLQNSLLPLLPDPAHPQTLWPKAAIERSVKYASELRHEFFRFQALPEYPTDDTDFGADSLSAWLKGKPRKALALLETYRKNRPYWLKTRRSNLRVLVTDDSLNAYQRWTIEFEKRVAMPLGETAYLVPRKSLQGLTLPEGDFTVWDRQRVTVNGYANGRWTHSTAYDSCQGNDIDDFTKLRRQLLQLAQTEGRKLEA